MERKLPSSITLIVYSLLTTFFNQVLIVPFIYKLNFKLSFFVLLIAYFIQVTIFILIKFLYERIRINSLLYYKIRSEKLYKIYWIIHLIISITILFLLTYFFFSFIDNYFFVNAKYIFIVPLLFIIGSYGISKSFYSIFQLGTLVFLLLTIQFIIFSFAPKTIDISVFLPIDLINNGANIRIFYICISLILFPILSIPLGDKASNPYTYKEIIIISIITYISNAYFLFMQTRQLGALLTYVNHPFYIIFDALDLGYYSEHLYIVPVTLCLITTFIFILFLLHSIKEISFSKKSYILGLFTLILLISMYLFLEIYIFDFLINLFIYLLPSLLFFFLIFSFIVFRKGGKNYEKDTQHY